MAKKTPGAAGADHEEAEGAGASPPSPRIQARLASIDRIVAATFRGEPAKLATAVAEWGAAPKRLDGPLKWPLERMGQALAEKGRLVEISTLAGLGWARALFPVGRSGASLASLASRGPKGLAALDALHAAGVKASDESGMLAAAAARLDQAAVDHFRGAIEREKPPAARAAQLRGELLRGAFDDPRRTALIEPWIKADPKGWARASESFGGQSALSAALGAGRIDLARLMAEAEPAAASTADIARCAYGRKPLEALAFLAEMGLDPKAKGRRGATALHHAVLHRSRQRKKLVRELLRLGLDPREPDEDGATPIGAAAGQWTWREIQREFDARGADLMDSMDRSRPQGGCPSPSLIESIRHAGLEEELPGLGSLAREDARLLDLIQAAFEDPRAREPGFIDRGLRACADAGLPACLEAFARMGAMAGSPLGAEHLKEAVGTPMDEEREKGRLLCLRKAAELGVDLTRPFETPLRGWVAEKTTLIQEALRMCVEYADSARFEGDCFAPSAAKARCLAELGCDPSEARSQEEPGEEGAWSFKDPGRRKLPANVRSEFQALDALAEAAELRASIKQRPAPKARAPRRI